jgi:CRISPR/Cas system-associated protein Cas10 (large subunit of type III CRISPR-Cas system)
MRVRENGEVAMTDRLIFNPVKEEPCVSCGEETAIGSVFFSDRREATAPDGSRYFVCSECLKRVTNREQLVDLDDPDLYRSLTALGMWQFLAPWIG